MAPQDLHEIEKEPMFCVSIMLACLYWSLLVYDYSEVRQFLTSLLLGCHPAHAC